MEEVNKYLQTENPEIIAKLNLNVLLNILFQDYSLYQRIANDDVLWTEVYKMNMNSNPEFPTEVFFQYQERYNRRLFVTGKNSYNKLLPIDGNVNIPTEITVLPSVIKIAFGENHTIFLTHSKEPGLTVDSNPIKVYGVGDNSKGQLGFSDLINRTEPQQIFVSDMYYTDDVVCGANFTYIIGRLRNRRQVMYNMGDNSNGQLAHGQNEYQSDSEMFAEIYQKMKAKHMGNANSAVADPSGSSIPGSAVARVEVKIPIRPLIRNPDKKIYATPTRLLFDFRFDRILCGESHTIFISDGDLYGVGSNKYGQLGFAELYESNNVLKLKHINPNEPVLRVESGKNHVVYENYQNQILGMGDNSYGQLGLGELSNTKSSGPHNIAFITNEPSEFQYEGSGRINRTGNIDINYKAENITGMEIYCGANYTILKDINYMLVMGSNSNNQLLYENEAFNIKTPTITDLSLDVSDIYCGYEHVIYDTYNADLFGAGKNINGELGLGSTSDGKSSKRTYSYTTLLSNNLNVDNILDIYTGNMCSAFAMKGYVLVNYNFYITAIEKDEIHTANTVRHEKTGLNIIFFTLTTNKNRNFITYDL